MRRDIVLPFPRMRVRYRGVSVAAVLVVVIAFALATGVGRGDYSMTPIEVLRILLGGGDEIERTVVLDWRLPRGLVALVVGIALGGAGALTQSLARNPLASPDILGISMGSSAAAVTAVVLFPAFATAGGLPAAALFGGLLAAALIAVLTWSGGMDPLRLVLVGVGVNAIGGAIVSYMLVRADLHEAAKATVWLTGSLTGRTWSDVVPVLVTVVISAIALAVLSFDLRVMHVGDALSRALGVPLGLVRGLTWVVAVAMTSVAVSAAGPIGFVALAAPQIARMAARSPTPPLVLGALVGGALVLCSDLAAQMLLPDGIPVGVVTAILGGPFLMYLLIRGNRKVTL